MRPLHRHTQRERERERDRDERRLLLLRAAITGELGCEGCARSSERGDDGWVKWSGADRASAPPQGRASVHSPPTAHPTHLIPSPPSPMHCCPALRTTIYRAEHTDAAVTPLHLPHCAAHLHRPLSSRCGRCSASLSSPSLCPSLPLSLPPLLLSLLLLLSPLLLLHVCL